MHRLLKKSASPVRLFAAVVLTATASLAANAQSLVGEYVVNGKPGNEPTLSASNVATGISFSTLTRSNLTAAALANSFNSVGFSSSPTLDNTTYLAFSINVDETHTLSLSNITYTDVAGSSGPAGFAMEYSLDNSNFTTIASYTPSTTATDENVIASGIGNVTNGTIYFRLAGYNAPSQDANNTYALINNPFVLNGTVSSATPEPGALTLALSMGVPSIGALALRRRARRRS